MVFLVVSNMNEGFSEGFHAAAIMDSLLSIYSILYLISIRNKTSE